MAVVRKQWLWYALSALAAVGCARYQPMPLNEASIDRSLTWPSPDRLQGGAAELRHPILKPVSIDLRGGLTPDSAAVLAVVANPAVRAQRARRSLASAQLLQAGLLPNPTLDFTLDPVTGGVTQGAVTAYNVGLSYELTALITHDAKLAAAKAQSQSVQLDVAWQEWQFAQAAKKAVYDLVALQAQAEQAATVDRQLGQNAELLRRAVEQHQKTVLDLAAAEATSQKAHSDFLAVQRDLRHQQLALNQALGLPGDARIPIAKSFALPSKIALPPDQELFASIDNSRLDLIALRRGYESQEQTLRAAVLAQFPKIVLGVHQASDNTGVISTGFGVTVDLPIFDRQQGNIAIQKATRQQLFDEYVSRIFDARSILAQVLADIRSITEQIAAAEASVPALEQLVRTYQLALEQGNVDVLSYYIAQTDLAQKRIDLLKLKQQLLDNQIALEIATGRFLPAPPATAPTSRPATMEVQ